MLEKAGFTFKCTLTNAAYKNGQFTDELYFERLKQDNESMINRDEITIRPLTDADLPLLEDWFDQTYIAKWFGDKEDWLCEINKREGAYSFLTYFIVYHHDQRIGYSLLDYCLFIKNLDKEEHEFKRRYGNVTKPNDTYEIVFLIGQEE